MSQEQQDPKKEESVVEEEPEQVNGSGVDEADSQDAVEESLQADTGTELKEAQDRYLRAEAEMQNLRRRVERDIENAHKFALERFVGDLLPVVDNLERALASFNEDQAAAVREGIELTLKSFTDVLAKFKVEAVDPQGQPFNPESHQAMSMVEHPDVAPNTVIEVFQKGYTLNGRLVRPAMVVVAKSPAN